MHATHSTVSPDGTQDKARMAAAITPNLLDLLSQRQAQAERTGIPYVAPVAESDAMLFWLARACRQARAATGRKQVHVAASADVDQSTVNRFEKGKAWPRNADRLVAAYAADLDIDPIDLWEQALRDWMAGA